MKILVTGATGLVGNLVARRLLNEGHDVQVTVRDLHHSDMLRNIFSNVHVANLLHPESLPKIVSGADAVVHCAALVGSGRADESEYMRVNAEGTRALLQAAASAGVKRFVLMSTVGVYGTNTLKKNLDESTPYGASSAYANSKIEAEKIVRAGSVPYTILRPYWITGAGDRFLIPAVADMLRKSTFSLIGDGQQEWSLSAVENVSAAVALAATHPNADNKIYNLADATVKVAETIQVIADALHLPMPEEPMPVVKAFFELLFSKRMTIDLFFPLWRGVTINTDKIRSELGWTPHIPWQDSVRRGALEWKQRSS